LVVQQYKLPRHLLDALIEGFAWDAGGRTYDSIEDLHAYGARVAGSVGAMMSWIMGPQSMDTLARACELGVAMQLTNIARDVGADARIARVYLPAQWLRQEGIDPAAWLERPLCSPALQRVVERQLDQHRPRVLEQRQRGVDVGFDRVGAGESRDGAGWNAIAGREKKPDKVKPGAARRDDVGKDVDDCRSRNAGGH
jgi:phytoene synthase